MENKKNIIMINKEHRKEYQKEYRKTDVYKEYMKAYRKNNKDKIKEYMKAYKETDESKKRQKEYYKTDESKERQKEYRKSNVYKNIIYKKKYGITLEDYNIMFSNQNGCCKICGTHQSELPKALAVDHCHKTNNVRGLLCQTCNTSLGGFKDNIDLLQNAIDYLKN